MRCARAVHALCEELAVLSPLCSLSTTGSSKIERTSLNCCTGRGYRGKNLGLGSRPELITPMRKCDNCLTSLLVPFINT